MHKIIKPALLLLALASAAAAQASDVNFGVSVGGEMAPGVYGRVNIGNTRPAVVYAQPVVIVPPPRPLQPIYMNVPPGHAKNWGKHCHRYHACNQPVYFVRTAEYGGPGGGHRGDHHHDHHYDRHDDHHGHGKGHGHGKHKH
ncbi:hypothetical protein EDC30_11060 [Paucimonas lemoignei]|uniref:Uncharacterized protein n=1 Tax=Paucimonas lemoignei TaxID=29443 RepID=A0A4R3HRJ2_PAULE|nr:hypothetical protein [Paucimonas lemoignei]TCS35592.1 hypothetical protein EDC30_11060 [Paucimonas lemoignei]